jgi:acetyl esterase
MPLDAKAQTLLDARHALGGRPIDTLSVADARAQTIQQSAPLNKRPTPVAAVLDRTIPGPGGELPVRIYRPAGQGPFPTVVYFHGGGFVICNVDTHDGLCRALCDASGHQVVSVDYRLAPEHKFPAAINDVHAATRWVFDHGPEIDSDPARIFVAGDSAGGCLATAVCTRFRDEGGPTPIGQVLIYPITTLHLDTTPSYAEFADGYGLTRGMMLWFLTHYLADPSQANDPLASPLLAHDLSGLPPALIFTAEYDPLRDEAEQYAARLSAAGVPTALVRYDGMFHGFFRYVGLLDQALEGIVEMSGWLKEIGRGRG